MRSRTFVKRTIPCLAVVLALTAQGQMAHAGLLSQIKAKTASLFNSKGAAQTTQTSADAAVEAVTHHAQPAIQPEAAPLESVAPVAEVLKKELSGPELVWNALQQIQNKANSSHANSDNGSQDISRLRGSVQVVVERAANIKNDHHTQISTQYTEDKLVLKLRVDETALNKPELLIKDLSVILALSHSTNITAANGGINFSRVIESPHSWAETFFNASEGSPVSQARLAGIEKTILDSAVPQRAAFDLSEGKVDMSKSAEQIAADRDQAAKSFESLTAKAEKYARQQKKALDQWRSETQALDKYEAMTDKLNDLMLKNDRKGVRNMLEAYLPWQTMEPTEYKAWKTWLDAIENPDLSHATVAFRGLDYKTDKIQRVQTAQGEKFAFMSTVLTKNQGSYTRRLRSLTVNREKNGDEGFTFFGSKLMTVKITDQMTAHARDPKASSFLSFTYNPFVARRFLANDKVTEVNGKNVRTPSGGLLAVKIDSRRMVPNVVSMYSNEIELLAPLIVFPDEVIAYHEGDFNSGKDGKTNDQLLKEFVAEISAKSGINFNNWDSYVPDKEMTARFKKDGLSFFQHLSEQAVNAPFCSKIF